MNYAHTLASSISAHGCSVQAARNRAGMPCGLCLGVSLENPHESVNSSSPREVGIPCGLAGDELLEKRRSHAAAEPRA